MRKVRPSLTRPQVRSIKGWSQSWSKQDGPAALDWWAARIRKWRQGKQPRDAKLISEYKPEPSRRDIFVYFDNDAKVHAPFNAKSLAGQFGIAPLSFPTRK